MTDFLNSLFQWINTHPEWAGLATFLISAAESIAIIGTIVPGTVMMTAVGALAGAGVMPLWSTLLWAILGAVAGDGISYWIGYYFKDRLHDIWPFRTHPYILARGETFFHKHGGKSVFIGRFVGPVRALVPLVAGMLKMQPWRFIIANVTSAIGWAPAYMLPGIALGAASLELPPDIAVHAILMLLLVSLFIIFCIWMVHKLFWLIGNKIHSSLTQLWKRWQKSPLFSPITTLLQHYNPQKTYGQLTLAFYFIVTSLLFFCFATFIKWHSSDHIPINQFFYHLFRSLRTSTGENIMIGITLLGDSKLIYFMTAALILWFAKIKRWRLAFHILFLAILSFISIEFFKHWVHSARPGGIVHSPKGGSFPSGHTTLGLVFYFGLAFLLNKAFHGYRKTLLTIATLLVLAIGISRLYLSAHWFTDIAGGLILGADLLMLTVISFNRQFENQIQPLRVIVTFIAALAIGYSSLFFIYAKKWHDSYALVKWPTTTLNETTWWNQEGNSFPLYRTNRFGISKQLLNIQWEGDINDIKKLLLENGWTVPEEMDWILVIHRLSDVQSAEHLPLVSPLYFDKKPELVLTKPFNGRKRLIVVRFWKANIELKNRAQPLWVGVIETVPRTYSWLFPHKKNNDIREFDSAFLSQSIENKYVVKRVPLVNYRQHSPKTHTILLIKPKH